MSETIEKCPSCGCTRSANIFLDDMGAYRTSLYIPMVGKVCLCACANCGVVYLPDKMRSEVQKYYR